MFDELLKPSAVELFPSMGLLFGRLVLALAMGFVVALVYRFSIGGRRDGVVSLAATLVLLTILIAMVTVVIGNSVARAFGLVGALSIVRFRTVVEDTRDTAFVIFAVVVGMACGTGYGVLLAIGIPIVAVAAVIMGVLIQRHHLEAAAKPRIVQVRVRIGLGSNPVALINPVWLQHNVTFDLVGGETARQGSAFELIYRVQLGNSVNTFDLLKALNAIDGVQSVELRDVPTNG